MTSTRTDSSSEQHHGSLLQMVRSIPGAAREIWRGKQAAWQASAQLRHPLRDIEWDTDTAAALQSEVERLLPTSNKSFTRTDQVQSALVCEEDCIILEEIKTLTQEHNRSNITRTAAYLECYEQYPELHWALLAHMVSRNGGYHMTDLQSDLMHNLQNQSDREHMYRLLERCNALIFQDAYPQLLLYMNSRRIGRSCFHLLSHFHVSAFMTPFWERFWLERCSSLLSVALIINEQNYIESRVVQHPYFQKEVLSKPAFHLHNLAGLNHIVFPLGRGQDSQDASLNILANWMSESCLAKGYMPCCLAWSKYTHKCWSSHAWFPIVARALNIGLGCLPIVQTRQGNIHFMLRS